MSITLFIGRTENGGIALEREPVDAVLPCRIDVTLLFPFEEDTVRVIVESGSVWTVRANRTCFGFSRGASGHHRVRPRISARPLVSDPEDFSLRAGTQMIFSNDSRVGQSVAIFIHLR
jgi:hypothetical protein